MMILIAIAIIFLLTPTALMGGNYNHRDLIPGGRSAFLGGAYTAIANDPSGLFFNPAGVAFSNKGEISLNTTAFYKKETKFKAAVNGQDFEEFSNANFPISIGSLYSIGKLSLGYLILSRDFQDTIQSDYFENIATQEDFANTYSRFQQESTLYQLYGLGFAVNIGKKFSIGLSNFFYSRKRKLTIHQHASFVNQNIFNLDQSVYSESTGGQMVFGILCNWETFALGLSASTIEEVMDKTTLSQDSLQISSEAETAPTNEHTELDDLAGEDNLFPNTYRLGLMFNPAKFFKFSSDLVYHAEEKHLKNTSGVWDLNPVINVSIGIEFILGNMNLQAGAFTNYSAAKKIEPTPTPQPDKIDFTGYSVGIGYGLKNFGTSFGYVLQQGRGEAKKVAGVTNIQEVSSQSQTGYLSMHYYL